MPSLKWVFHKGKRILYADIASQNDEELLDIVARLKLEIEKEPLGSVLAVCEVKGGKTSSVINKTLKEFVKYIDPYIKIIAVVGVEGLQKILYNSVLMFTRSKKLTIKNSEEGALDWLAEQ